VARGALDLDAFADEAEKSAHREAEAKLAPALARVREALGERVADVRASARLTDSPACLVVGEGEATAHLERMLRAAGHEAPQGKPVLELNPSHPLVRRLAADDGHLADWSNVLFDQALLAEGAPLADPAAFVRSMNALLVDLVEGPKPESRS